MTNLATNLAVCGLHRLGQPLNSRLTRLGATYVKTCKSSAEYKMYVIPGKVWLLEDESNSSYLQIWYGDHISWHLSYCYQYPLQEGKPAKPGMLLVTGKSGEAIEIEIWSIEVCLHNLPSQNYIENQDSALSCWPMAMIMLRFILASICTWLHYCCRLQYVGHVGIVNRTGKKSAILPSRWRS